MYSRIPLIRQPLYWTGARFSSTLLEITCTDTRSYSFFFCRHGRWTCQLLLFYHTKT